MSDGDGRYELRLDNKYGYLRVIDVPAEVEACDDQWYNQTLTEVDDSVVRLGVLRGEFHWHHHEAEDEFFFVLDGTLYVDLENEETVVLGRHQGFNVPRGTAHRTRAPDRTVVLMMSGRGVAPTGDR